MCVCVCALICMRMCFWRMNAIAGVVQLFVSSVTWLFRKFWAWAKADRQTYRQTDRHHLDSEDLHKSYLQCQAICQLLLFVLFARLNAGLSWVKWRSHQGQRCLQTFSPNNSVMKVHSEANSIINTTHTNVMLHNSTEQFNSGRRCQSH